MKDDGVREVVKVDIRDLPGSFEILIELTAPWGLMGPLARARSPTPPLHHYRLC